MDTQQEVLFSEMPGKNGNIGVITLNRPQVLNSLNHSMIISMHAQLKKWSNATAIKAVMIEAAEGRAFCAGGDLRSMHLRHQTNDDKLTSFFYDEYQLNRCIFHFPKPYIAFLDGITMGGGVGISLHGSHRIATENLMFAMPETGIGFFPDVGGTYFLPRLSGKLGYYLGLTGARIKADDCVALGLTQVKVARESLPIIKEKLAETTFDTDSKQTVSGIINEFKESITVSYLLEQQKDLDVCFGAETMEEIIANLTESENALCKESLLQLEKKSPTSLKVTLQALLNGATMDFDTCMRQEFRLVSHFLKAHDFIEGVRAVIIDKDQKPHWKPAKLSEISKKDVEKYFSPVEHELV